MVILGQLHLPSQSVFQHIHIMRKLLVYAKCSAQAPEHSFLKSLGDHE